MFQRDLFTPDRLFCPGPTPVPKSVAMAMSETSIYHRSEEFYKVFRRCTDRLAPIFGTTTLPLILTASGSGAMESVLVSLTDVGDEVVVVNGGKFGERWEKLAKAFQCQTEVVAVPWGQAPSAGDVLAAVSRQKKTKAIFLQANETSTGAYYKIESLVKELRQSFKGLICVDAISSLIAHPMRMDEWAIDAVVSGSQKGFGLPPGLAFAALSERAWGQLSKRPRFYFDLEKERKGQAEGRSAWTPAASLIFALDAALQEIHEVSIERVLEHHATLARAARAAVQAMGLELFAVTAPSNTLTSITVPTGVDGQRLLKRLRQRFGMFFAGGQDELKGKIVRFSHLGFVSRFDLIDGIAALEFALREEGFHLDLGNGVKAAMQILATGN